MRWHPLRDLKTAIASICDRLECLESTPAPELELEPIHRELSDLTLALRHITGHSDTQQRELELLKAQTEKFTIALSEGIEHVDRAERRIHATVKRARAKLKDLGYEDPGLDAEAAELRARDGDGSEAAGVQLVPEDVEEASSVHGVSKATLRRVRGF